MDKNLQTFLKKIHRLAFFVRDVMVVTWLDRMLYISKRNVIVRKNQMTIYKQDFAIIPGYC